MDFERTFEDFLMEAKTYGTWGGRESASNYLYRFYDIAITSAPNVPLRKAFEELLRMRDNRRNSFLRKKLTEEAELDIKFIHELHKTLKYLASSSLTQRPAA